jgi:hypothetical protein
MRHHVSAQTRRVGCRVDHPRWAIRTAVVLIACLGAAVTGCSGPKGPPTFEVSGDVTFAGNPVEQGSIVFDPVSGTGGSAIAGIANGRFTARVPAGEMILRVSAVRTTGEKDQYGEPVSESYIPSRYNQESTLRQTIEPRQGNRIDLVLEGP